MKILENSHYFSIIFSLSLTRHYLSLTRSVTIRHNTPLFVSIVIDHFVLPLSPSVTISHHPTPSVTVRYSSSPLFIIRRSRYCPTRVRRH